MISEPEIHELLYKGKTLVLDVNTSTCLELDALASEVLRGAPPQGEEALEELRQLMKMGLFRRTSFSPPEEFVLKTVRLAIAPECNLMCRYCYTGRSSRKDRRMSVQQALKVVDFFVDGGTSPLTFSFGLTGEPLLALDLFKAVKEHVDLRSRETGRKLSCFIPNTNATLLTQDVARELSAVLRGNLSSLVISIDGPRHIHDAARCFPKGEGSYERIEPLVREHVSRWPAVASAVLTGERPYVTEIFLHLFELGFRSIHIKPVRIDPRSPLAITRRNIDKVKGEYSKFVRFLLSQDDLHLLYYLSAIYKTDFFGRFFLRLLTGAKLLYRCPAAKEEVAVDTKGDIYPCDSFIGIKEFKLGNVFDGGIDKGKQRRFILLHVDRKPVCSSCWARYLCGGGCYHSAWLATGRIETPDPVKCQLVRHLIEQGMVLLAEISQRNPKILRALLSKYRFRSPQGASPSAVCKFTPESPFPNPSRWEGATPIRLCREDQFRGPKLWGGEEDLSGEIRTLWDDRCFYIRADVRDDIFLPPASLGRLSDGDSFQFALGSHEYGLALISGNPILARTAAPPEVPLGEVRNSQVSIVRRGDITIYQAAVPWEELRFEPTSETCSFNVVLNERDHPFQSRAWMEWAPGMVVEKDPSLFGRLTFDR